MGRPLPPFPLVTRCPVTRVFNPCWRRKSKENLPRQSSHDFTSSARVTNLCHGQCPSSREIPTWSLHPVESPRRIPIRTISTWNQPERFDGNTQADGRARFRDERTWQWTRPAGRPGARCLGLPRPHAHGGVSLRVPPPPRRAPFLRRARRLRPADFRLAGKIAHPIDHHDPRAQRRLRRRRLFTA